MLKFKELNCTVSDSYQKYQIPIETFINQWQVRKVPILRAYKKVEEIIAPPKPEIKKDPVYQKLFDKF